MQFFYGIGTSTEIAYYSYIYAKVDAVKYQKVTSFTRVATLSSIFLSSVTGQVIMRFSLHEIFSEPDFLRLYMNLGLECCIIPLFENSALSSPVNRVF